MASNKFRYFIVKIFRSICNEICIATIYKNKNPLEVYHDISARLCCINDK